MDCPALAIAGWLMTNTQMSPSQSFLVVMNRPNINPSVKGMR
jgi:hypothetical protein